LKKILLKGFGLLGTLVFVPLFVATFLDPQLIEKSARPFIEWKLNQDVNKQIDSIDIPKEVKFERLLGEKTKQLRAETEKRIQTLQRQLKNDAPTIIADQIAQMFDLNCECRKKWQQNIRQSMQLELASLETAKAKLIDFTQIQYMKIVEKLTEDVRIFVGINAVIFIMLLALSVLKTEVINVLFVPGVLMLISTIVCSYFYIFQQNWLFSILYNDYTGFGYLFYLGLVFAFLCDITFNKARITRQIVKTIVDSISNAFPGVC